VTTFQVTILAFIAGALCGGAFIARIFWRITCWDHPMPKFKVGEVDEIDWEHPAPRDDR
jgi:hypothetical protein